MGTSPAPIRPHGRISRNGQKWAIVHAATLSRAWPPADVHNGRLPSSKCARICVVKVDGPWGPRRLVACYSAQIYGSLSKSWDLVAQSLHVSVPEPPLRANQSTDPLQVRGYIPKHYPLSPTADKQSGLTSLSDAKPSPPCRCLRNLPLSL